MKKRIITGICVSLFWLTLLLWAPTWCLFPVLLAATLVCVHEYCAMLKRAGMEVSQKFLMAAGSVWLGVCYMWPNGLRSFYPGWMFKGMEDPLGDYPAFFRSFIHKLCWNDGFPMLLAVLALGLFILFARVLFDSKIKKPFEMLGTTTLAFFYIPFMLGFFVRLAQFDTWRPFELTREGIFLAFFVALITKAGDSGAYAAGMVLGKHKMFPRISPKKSWEGLIGGFALSAGVGMGFVWLAQNVFPATHFATLRQFLPHETFFVSVVLCGIGVIGDLIESQLKRATNTKDSSSILPGMGGLLDNFDSLLFTPAAFYFYLLWMYG